MFRQKGSQILEIKKAKKSIPESCPVFSFFYYVKVKLIVGVFEIIMTNKWSFSYNM